jgi:hypothetical protein
MLTDAFGSLDRDIVKDNGIVSQQAMSGMHVRNQGQDHLLKQ